MELIKTCIHSLKQLFFYQKILLSYIFIDSKKSLGCFSVNTNIFSQYMHMYVYKKKLFMFLSFWLCFYIFLSIILSYQREKPLSMKIFVNKINKRRIRVYLYRKQGNSLCPTKSKHAFFYKFLNRYGFFMRKLYIFGKLNI